MNPHAEAPVTAGIALEQATKALVLLHGRGASPESILPLAAELAADNYAVIAPRAGGRQWYPQRFVAPRESNEPFLGFALEMLETLLAKLAKAGIPTEKTVLAGFSQGACLAAEYVAGHPARYGGLLVFSGGLIGEGNSVTRDLYTGNLAETPVFNGCSDTDFHIPLDRVKETTRILTELGATVTEKIYPGMGHTIMADELEHANAILTGL